MAHKSTGVFRVPVSENGIIPTALNIMLNNDSRCHTSNVTVTVKRSRNTFSRFKMNQLKSLVLLFLQNQTEQLRLCCLLRNSKQKISLMSLLVEIKMMLRMFLYILSQQIQQVTICHLLFSEMRNTLLFADALEVIFTEIAINLKDPLCLKVEGIFLILFLIYILLHMFQ